MFKGTYAEILCEFVCEYDCENDLRGDVGVNDDEDVDGNLDCYTNSKASGALTLERMKTVGIFSQNRIPSTTI